MDAMDLLIKELQAQLQSNQHLLQSKDMQLERIEAKLHEVVSQHTSVTEQYSQALDEKDHKIALLEAKIKRLLSTVRGSRQERINPNQLLLFSQDELRELAEELEKSAQENADPSEPEADPPQDPSFPRRACQERQRAPTTPLQLAKRNSPIRTPRRRAQVNFPKVGKH
jgi:hypothetical protein